MKLIDGHAMIQRVEALHKRGTVDLPYYNIVKEAVQMEPSVDAVPVILCRNCKYGEPETNGFGEDMVMCQNKQNPIGYEDWLMPPEFYCADGERRG